MESASQESLLTSAGFQTRTPSTEKQKAAYQKLPAYQLHRITLKGRTVYAYKDEKAGVAYLGNQAQYEQYRQLAANAKLKEEQITPVEASLEEEDMRTYNQMGGSHSVGRRRTVKQAAANAKLKEEKQVAHDMDNDLTYRWYGSWKDFGAASPVD